MSRWGSPKRGVGYRPLPPDIRDDAEYSVPQRTRVRLSTRQQVELGLTVCDEVPLQPTHCCFVPNNDVYIHKLIGRNPCAEPPEPTCCDLYDFD